MREQDSRAGGARQNAAERAFEQLARGAGWLPSKRGWPDFWCRGPDGAHIAVEVKPRTSTGRCEYLKPDQVRVLEWLTAAGIRCYVSDGATLEPYARGRHARPGLNLA